NARDQRPFVSRFTPDADTLRWRARSEAGGAALAEGDTTAAIDAYMSAVHIDSTAADGLYAAARLRDAHGDLDAARTLYREARERDELRFRAPEAMNAIIREVAARH